MEISKSISYITEDPRWQQKLLIGTGVLIASSVLSVILIGFLGFIIFAGYCVRLLQNVRDGQTYPMPEWDQWGEDLTRGFKLIIATLVWALPVLILVIPSAIGGVMADNSNGDGVKLIGMMLLLCGNCASLIYGLLLAIAAPGITIAFAKDEQLTSGLQFRQIIDWTRANIGQVLVVTLVVIALSIALSLIGTIVGTLLCVVGLIVTLPLATLLTGLVQYHLYGQMAFGFPYPDGSGGIDATPTSYATPAYATPTYTAPEVTPPVEPTAAPLVPPVGTDTPVGDSTDYPDSGVDNPAPPPAA